MKSMLELRRFSRSRLTRLALAGVIVLPLLYAGLYLWSFWDPQGHLDRIPVALVMQDQPSGELHAGRDLADELKEREVLGWREASAQEAADGVADGTFYVSLTIPADFSARLASPAQDGAPTPAELGVRVDTGRSYIMGTISDAVFTEVKDAAARTAVRDYLDQVFVSIGDIHDKTREAADGAGELRDGAAKAGKGITTLNDGLGQTEGATRQLSTGLGDANTATAKLADGSAQVTAALRKAEAGTAKLNTALDQLHDGAGQVADGNRQASEQVHAQSERVNTAADRYVPQLNEWGPQLGDAAAAIADAADRLAEQGQDVGDLAERAREVSRIAGKVAAVAPELGATVDGARDQYNQLDEALAKLATGAAKVDKGLGKASTSTGELAAGVAKVADGSAKVTGGLGELGGGLVRLGDGATKLQTGVGRLHDGAGTLDRGMDQLTDGSKQLADGLSDGAEQIPSYGKADRDSRTDMMADPVRLATTVDNEVPNYGTGFAPFFLPLALWVGAMIAYMVLRPLNPRLLAGTSSAVRIALAGWLPAVALGAAQVGVLLAVLRFGLGLQAAHWAGVAGILLLATAAFLALVQAVNALLGAPGRVAALALLMLQLTSAAGTYPIETSPGFFQTISPWLPMSWVVSALRRLISGGDLTVVWQACGVLTAFLLLGLALTTLAVERGRTWSLKRLHPELAI